MTRAKDLLPMIAKTYTCSLLGVDAILVEVEADVSPGLPFFATVGLPDREHYHFFTLDDRQGSLRAD